MRLHMLAIAGLTGLALGQPPAPPPAASPALEWTPAAAGVTARLRGVSAASARVIWASGADGTVIRTSDAGATWERLLVPDAASLDFRDIDAVSESVAYQQVDVLLAEPWVDGPLHQDARQRAFVRRVEHGRGDRARSRRYTSSTASS